MSNAQLFIVIGAAATFIGGLAKFIHWAVVQFVTNNTANAVRVERALDNNTRAFTQQNAALVEATTKIDVLTDRVLAIPRLSNGHNRKT